MRTDWFERELGGLFYTFHEFFRAARLGRLAPFLATAMLVAAAGVVLLILLDLFAVAYGKVTTRPPGQGPRSIAAVAIFAGYYLWDRFACPERIALLESLDATASPHKRQRRRLKTVAFTAALVMFCGVVFQD
jgi:hypothetical protein